MLYAIIGGGGYVGFHIAVTLIQEGEEVVIFDLSYPHEEWIEDAEALEGFVNNKFNLKFVKGDILSEVDLTKAMLGADVVIHCVSYGMSGPEQLHYAKTEKINIQGTKNVIAAATAVGAKGLVYTSTFNVVFGGEEIRNGDETLPYFPLYRFVDHYSRTKSIAEQLVLVADGKKTYKTELENTYLRTCSLRLGGVIGPKEKRHLPRIVNIWYMFRLRFGYGTPLSQFAGIENIVQAHIKAAKGLITKPDLLGGQAYFISDGVAINPFDYFSPIIKSLGHGVSTRNNVPMFLVWFGTYFLLFLHFLLHRIWEFYPLFTPAEIYKTAVTHYFSNDKATRDFGYVAQNPNDVSKVCLYYSQKQKKNS